MDAGQEIITEAERLFDVSGVTRQGDDSTLVLGLVTKPDWDLNDFFRARQGAFDLKGLRAHAEALLDPIGQLHPGTGPERRIDRALRLSCRR